MRKTVFKKIGITVSATALASAMVIGSVPQAMAATNDSFWQDPTSAATVDSNLLKTYGVRAGSAGPDFLGITNTNFDAIGSKPADGNVQSDKTSVTGVNGAPLALWATNVNEAPNPYYQNLYLNVLNGNTAASPAATTWITNPSSSSWGDSNGMTSGSSIAGLEYKPDIIFGANKSTNWTNFDASNTNIGQAAKADSSYNPVFTNNDSTNVWTQIYTLEQLGKAADGISGKTTRYTATTGNAAESALNYEKALRGNLLWIASQIDQGKAKKKTVAYLYAIDENGTGYFFIPQASGLVRGNDTSATSTSAATTANTNYAANNGTIDLDYMDTLPFITDTFTGGNTVTGGIVMKVEDIYKSNPAHSLAAGTKDALKDVDVIIYNSTKNTDIGAVAGTSGFTSNGKNESNIDNDYQGTALSRSKVNEWAEDMGFSGKVIAGDDWGTSNQQNYGTAATTSDGMSPLLYCQRNYTTDKPARAAWAFSKVYSELYPNADASYAYWVNKVYHIKTASVPTVTQYLTNLNHAPEYTESTAQALEADYQAGLDWWVNTGSKNSTWNQFAYYSGSSRASYYDSSTASEEPANTIGIFAPTETWAAKATKTPTATKKANTVKAASTKVNVKKGKTKTVKITKAQGKITAKTSKKSVATVSPKSSSKKSVTLKIKGVKKGKATITVKAAGNGSYKAKSIKIAVTVK